MKRCTGCGTEKRLGEFHAHPRGLYGRAAKCMACANAKKMAHYRDNHAEVRAAENAKRHAAGVRPRAVYLAEIRGLT